MRNKPRAAAVALTLMAAIAAGCQRGASAEESAGDWLQFRGPTGQRASDERGLPVEWNERKNLAWKVKLPGAGSSTPILYGDRIYLTCYSGYNVPGRPTGRQNQLRRHVLCLNRRDGTQNWSAEVKSKLPEQETIRDAHGYASSTPAVDDERIYAFFGKSGVVALDHAGEQLWHADVGGTLHGWGSAASLVLHEDLAIVNASVESESLVALDKRTGDEVWRKRGIAESWNTPLLVRAGNRTELIVAIQGKILGIDPAGGQELWSCDTDIGWYMVPSVVESGGVVYAIGGRSGTAALAVRTGGRGDVTQTHRLWTSTKGSNVSSPIVHEGHLYYMNDNQGIAYCAECETGEIVYEERVEGAGQVYASPVLVDGKIYYVGRDGRVFVVAARPRFEQLAVNFLGDEGTFNSGFAVGGGRMYLRNDEYLYCIGRK